MSIPLENTVLDSLLRVPRLSFGESENLDIEGLITKLLDFNPRHEWHAYTPGALNSIFRDVASPTMKQRLRNTSTDKLTVERLHGMLASRLPNVPELDQFCEILGTPRSAPVIGGTRAGKAPKEQKTETTPAKPKPRKAQIRARKKSKAKAEHGKVECQWQACEGNRILSISIPPSKLNKAHEHAIEIRGPDMQFIKEDTNFGISSGPNQRMSGLALQFPTTQIRNTARHNLRSHLLKYDGDDAFQLNVHDKKHSSNIVLPVLDVKTDDALSLLAILVRLFPVGGHSPIYTFEVDQPQLAGKALLVAAASCSVWLREKLSTAGILGPRASSNVYLSARCHPRCTNCPQKVEVIECDLPSA